jgi:hypothetical protein
MELTLHKFITTVDKDASRALLESHLAKLFPYVKEEVDDEWHAKDSRGSLDSIDGVSTMVMNKKHNMPMLRETFYGDSVRDSDNLAGGLIGRSIVEGAAVLVLGVGVVRAAVLLLECQCCGIGGVVGAAMLSERQCCWTVCVGAAGF